jgi:hypothetical protein
MNIFLFFTKNTFPSRLGNSELGIFQDDGVGVGNNLAGFFVHDRENFLVKVEVDFNSHVFILSQSDQNVKVYFDSDQDLDQDPDLDPDIDPDIDQDPDQVPDLDQDLDTDPDLDLTFLL